MTCGSYLLEKTAPACEAHLEAGDILKHSVNFQRLPAGRAAPWRCAARRRWQWQRAPRRAVAAAPPAAQPAQRRLRIHALFVIIIGTELGCHRLAIGTEMHDKTYGVSVTGRIAVAHSQLERTKSGWACKVVAPSSSMPSGVASSSRSGGPRRRLVPRHAPVCLQCIGARGFRGGACHLCEWGWHYRLEGHPIKHGPFGQP